MLKFLGMCELYTLTYEVCVGFHIERSYSSLNVKSNSKPGTAGISKEKDSSDNVYSLQTSSVLLSLEKKKRGYWLIRIFNIPLSILLNTHTHKVKEKNIQVCVNVSHREQSSED